MPRVFVLVLLLALAGCNANRAVGPEVSLPPTPATVTKITPQAENPNCAEAIASFRKLQDEDLGKNLVAQGVYDQIKGEIGEADSACAQGDNLRALGLLRETKAKHGYAGS